MTSQGIMVALTNVSQTTEMRPMIHAWFFMKSRESSLSELLIAFVYSHQVKESQRHFALLLGGGYRHTTLSPYVCRPSSLHDHVDSVISRHVCCECRRGTALITHSFTSTVTLEVSCICHAVEYSHHLVCLALSLFSIPSHKLIPTLF